MSNDTIAASGFSVSIGSESSGSPQDRQAISVLACGLVIGVEQRQLLLAGAAPGRPELMIRTWPLKSARVRTLPSNVRTLKFGAGAFSVRAAAPGDRTHSRPHVTAAAARAIDL